MAYIFELGRSPSAAGKLMAMSAFADDCFEEEQWLLSEVPADLQHRSGDEREKYGNLLRRTVGDSFKRRASFAKALQNSSRMPWSAY